uniref:endo-polygalacturonase n=1 Tax=Lygus lineolaris TaxID=50650 RepID=A0A126CQX8_LYGLI|nr:polygalacturonase 22a [Lygus lineolaris]
MASWIATLASLALCLTVAAAVDIWSVDQLEQAKRGQDPVIRVRNINVPAGKALDFQGLDGRTIEFHGRVTFGYAEWSGHLIIIKGKNMKIRGMPGHLIDGEGHRWWDKCGGNCGKKKPFMIYTQLQDSTVDGLKIKNTPAWCFAINECNNVHYSNIDIDNKDGHSKGGHNTDGFDVHKSRNIRIYNSKVNNQDDCLAINSGWDIVFENNVCEGGHGIAVAVGGYDVNEAKNILIKNCKVIKNNIGVRVKTLLNGKGIVDGITFDNVELKDISEIGIVIIGNYLNSGPRGDPTGGIPIKNLNINNVRGNVLHNGTNIQINVAPGSPSGWIWKSNVWGGRKNPNCKGTPGNLNDPCNW